MTATPTCKPWCDDHRSPDECYTRSTVYDDGHEDKGEFTSASLAAQLQARGAMATEIAWINIVASQEGEDERPLTDLQLFEAGNYEAVANVHLGRDGLRELHAKLGAVLMKLS